MAETEKLGIIEEADLEGKGVRGQADVPGLSAAEMQIKIEEIVREVAISKINEIINYINENGVSKEDLEELALEAGAVSSVFGRAGHVAAAAGDYTPEMVGAAPAAHAAQHGAEGSDPVAPEDIGAAKKIHNHGNILGTGYMGAPYNTEGRVLFTAKNGYIVGKEKDECGFVLEPEKDEATGAVAFTFEDNHEYSLSGVTSFRPTFGEIDCFGFVTFGESVETPEPTGMVSSDGDDISEAAPGETWEFSCRKGRVIWKNWGV